MKRCLLVLALALLLIAGGLIPSNLLNAGTTRNGVASTSVNKVDPHALRELLIKGLKVTRKDEEAFIDYVVELVVEQRLPVALVYASFQYARKQRPDIPFPYFVYSLQSLARRNKIEI